MIVFPELYDFLLAVTVTGSVCSSLHRMLTLLFFFNYGFFVGLVLEVLGIEPAGLGPVRQPFSLLSSLIATFLTKQNS